MNFENEWFMNPKNKWDEKLLKMVIKAIRIGL